VVPRGSAARPIDRERHDPMTCPNCGQPATELRLSGHVGTTVTIDVCQACQVFWFDTRESLQLSPAATLQLFRLIGNHEAGERRALSADARCPRCSLRLKPVHDQQRTTRFQYRRCPQEHGRLITYFDFLKEKNFIKPMSDVQVEQLRRHVASVNCSNCGASIDLLRHSACAHCGSALSMIDANQASVLVAELRAADRSGQPVDPALPLRLEQARREAARAFEQQDASWYEDVSSSGTVMAGLHALARWLSRDV
jgi:hypothetical protein